ncbi:hypothetical protein JCM8547_002666 [Rhodosporidiobolus lusitaniae]
MLFELPPTRITDPSFLEGLRVVLEPYYEQDPVPMEQVEAVVKRAEAFFLSTHADLPAFAQQPAPLSSVTSAPPASSSSSSSSSQQPPSSSQQPPFSSPGEDAPPYPPTFSELAHLISTGAPIPGIRTIPDQLASEPASEAKLANEGGAPKKPWEKEREVPGLRETAGEVGLVGEGGRDDAGGRETLQEEVKREEGRREAEDGMGSA